MRPSLLHREMPETASRPRLALAAKGFRPFFLLAAAFAALIVPVWILVLLGVARQGTYLDATTWHAHEMVFGFAVAVIAGFLLTAVGNWTQRESLVGTPLLALAGLWLLGRVAMVLPGLLPHGAAALVDLAFLPMLIVAIARPLVATRNRRNFVMLAILGALFAANLVVHLDALGVVPTGSARRASLVAVDVVVLVILIIAGRVLPMFTRNATGVTSIRSSPVLDALTTGGMAVITAVDALGPSSAAAAVISAVVGTFAVARAMHWGARHSGRQPLLWILHAGYAWIPIGLGLRALAGMRTEVSSSLATHALTVGAIGSLTLGMMARVALGHAGRRLVASKQIVLAFVSITGAAFARAIAPLFASGWYFAELVTAAALWTIAFVLYLAVYARILASARLDGKPG